MFSVAKSRIYSTILNHKKIIGKHLCKFKPALFIVSKWIQNADSGFRNMAGEYHNVIRVSR